MGKNNDYRSVCVFLQAAAYALTERTRLQQACHMHRLICGMLLAAYESLQESFEEMNNSLPPRKQLPVGEFSLPVVGGWGGPPTDHLTD